MLKMGYKSGTGLGKLGEGRIEPVEAVLLPEGSYFSKIFHLQFLYYIFIERKYIAG